jgi:hypothetical protein
MKNLLIKNLFNENIHILLYAYVQKYKFTRFLGFSVCFTTVLVDHADWELLLLLVMYPQWLLL